MADSATTPDQPDHSCPAGAPPEELFKKRIGRYDHYYDARAFSHTLRKTSKPKKVSRTSKYALLVRRNIDDRGRYSGTTIVIQSAVLCEILKDINTGVQGLDLNRANPEISPLELFHSYDGLCRRLQEHQPQETENVDAVADLMAAVHLVEEDQGQSLMEHANILRTGDVAYESLLLLFKPNTLVFTVHPGVKQDRLLLLREACFETPSGRTPYVKLTCDIFHHDGEDFGWTQDTLEIEEYRGVRQITSLDAYPLSFHEHSESVFSSAVALGKLFAEMPDHWLREYEGPGMRMGPLSSDPDERSKVVKFHATGRVMISPPAFLYHGPPENPFNMPVRTRVAKETLSELQYAICNPIVLGYSFARKTWGCFALSRMNEVIWNDDAFSSLVMNEKQKSLIHGLVKQHPEHVENFDDVIRGKGRGLIGLLAGPPGSGKTLTAEAVAEMERKPLYQVTAGELGTDEETVERRLLTVLDLAEMWDAVLLLDEAEVFLQQRSSNDLHRNAIVSIFLRHLEYYEGVLLMTTNLAQQCDAAFESRIHFSVHYQELDFDARKSVWSTFFRRASIDVEDAEVSRLAMHPINGRQIKNAFSSAQTISLSEGHTRLRTEDIDVVLDVLHDWQTAKAGNFTHSQPVPELEGLF